MAAKVEERILYDLLVPLEWPTERQDLVSIRPILSVMSSSERSNYNAHISTNKTRPPYAHVFVPANRPQR